MRADSVHRKTAGLALLGPDQCEEIYLAALEVLDRVGVNVFHPEALALLEGHGARVDGERARIPAWLVQRALATAPCRIPIARRGAGRAMLLERGRIYFGTGSDTQFTFDLESGRRRLATKQDVANAACLADALPNIDFVMSLGLAADVPAADSYVHQFEAMVLNTEKPILYTAADLKDVRDIVAMAEVIAGGADALRANPSLVLYAEPSSPLQHSREALEKLLYCADRRLPVTYVPAVMLGGSAPVTPAGGLVVCNAECLSGLVVHQLRNPGAPFIYGGSAPAMDVRTALCSYGSPELQLTCAGTAAIAHHLNLPVFTTAGCSDSQCFDPQAGMEAAYTLLVQALAGANLIHDLGYVGAGMCSSLEMLALCDEAAAMVKYFVRGLEVSPRTLALEAIERVGPGGNFLAEEHTVAHFRDSLCLTDLSNRLEYARWEQEGSREYQRRANEKVRGLLADHQPAPLPDEIVAEVRQISRRRSREA